MRGTKEENLVEAVKSDCAAVLGKAALDVDYQEGLLGCGKHEKRMEVSSDKCDCLVPLLEKPERESEPLIYEAPELRLGGGVDT